jgi:hypothetical protein
LIRENAVPYKGLLSLLSIAAVLTYDCQDLAAKEPIYCLSFKKLEIFPGERLSKFDLHIISGIVVEFPRVPLDWRIEIDNEANWMPEFSGTAIHGAANLEQRDFATDFVRVAGVPIDLVKSGMPKEMTVKGYLEFSLGDAKRVIPISDNNITLTSERPCRQKR